MYNEDLIDVGPEMDNLRERLENESRNLEISSQMGLNTLIYYFEKFLEQHKEYEKTKKDLLLLNAKIDQLSQGEENVLY